MKVGTLAVISAVALGVVGYAIWTLTADRGQTKAASVESATSKRAAYPQRRGKGGIKRVEPTVEGDGPPDKPKSGPAPRPVPKVSLEKARADFKAVIDRYDQLLEGGEPVDSDEWIKLYAAGAEAMLPLRQHLDWDVPEQAEEMRRAESDYRTKTDQLQTRVPVPAR